MDIILDDVDIKCLMSNIKNGFDKQYTDLKAYTNVNYNILYDYLDIIPNDIIKIIYNYTQDTYIFKCFLKIWPSVSTKIINIKFKNVICNDTYTIKISLCYMYIYGSPGIHNYEIVESNSGDMLFNDIMLFNEKKNYSHTENVVFNNVLQKNDIIYNTPEECIDVLVLVVNDLLRLLIKEGKNMCL